MAPFRFRFPFMRLIEVGWSSHYFGFNVFAQRQYVPDTNEEDEVGPIPSQTITFSGVPNLGTHQTLAGGGGTLAGYKVLVDGSVVPFTYGFPGQTPPEGGFLPWLIGHTGTEVITVEPIPGIKVREEQFETGTWLYPEEQPEAFSNGFYINYRAIAKVIATPNPTPGEPPIIPLWTYTFAYSAPGGDGISIGGPPVADEEPREPPDFTYVGTAASAQSYTVTVDTTNRIRALS